MQNLVLKKLWAIYRLVGAGLLMAVYIIAITIWMSSTIGGIENGNYTFQIVINTNTLGENYVELGLLLFTFPAVLVIMVKIFVKLFRAMR